MNDSKKAIELINIFLDGNTSFYQAREFATITADLLITELSKAHYQADLTNQLNFWQGVKKNIKENKSIKIVAKNIIKRFEESNNTKQDALIAIDEMIKILPYGNREKRWYLDDLEKEIKSLKTKS